MRIPSLMAFCLLIFIVQSRAQNSPSVQGKITDQEGKSISSASILVLNTNIGTSSNQEGIFELKGLDVGQYMMEVSAIGYATLTRAFVVPNTGKLEITLLPAARTLDDVVVSAQKKDEEMQQVPLAVTSLSARQVKQYRIWNSNELTAIVPNLYSANSGDDRNVTSIRGITTTSYDPAVATYIDGVNQFGLDTYIANLFDVDKIEVLRGPQGTLYGRNAMGGVINIITRPPGDALHAFSEINVGNNAQLRYSAGVRSPLFDKKLFIGIAAMYDSRDGFYSNLYDNSSYDKQNSITGNYYLKWIIGKGWDVLLNVKHHNVRNNGAFPLVFGADEALAHPFELTQNAVATMKDNTFNSSLSLRHHGHKVNFSSQTSWQSNRRIYDKPLDGDFSPIDGITIINDYGLPWNRVKVFTQEFRFSSSPTAASKLDYTAGMYLFLQDNPVKQATHFGEDADLLGSPDKNFALINTSKGKSQGGALYGQASYPLTSTIRVLAGLRFDYEKKKLSVLGEYQPDGSMAFVIRPDTAASVDYNALSPKLGLAWQVSPNNHVYLSYSRGFRTGGLTQAGTDPSQPPLYGYKPEYSNSVEAGIKNQFWQRHIRLNLAFFYTQVNDAQVPTLILPDAITVTRNAGKLSSKGAELELAAKAFEGFELEYNFGYTDASYKTLKLSQNGTEADLSGNKQVFTPDVTSQLALQYSFPLAKKIGLNMILRGEWAYIGSQYFDLANTIRQPGYSQLHARAGLAWTHFELMFWGRNLGDTHYISYAYDFGAVHLGNPRTYGVMARFQF